MVHRRESVMISQFVELQKVCYLERLIDFEDSINIPL